MYRRSINLDENSFLELSSRITGQGEQLMFSLRGLKNKAEATMASVILDETEVRALIKDLNDWLEAAPRSLDEIAQNSDPLLLN